jgi:uncharacterized protein
MMTSTLTGRDYRVSVLLPPGYSHHARESYPTVYVYDAVGERFGYMAELAGAAEIDRSGLIWVGIGPASEALFGRQRYSDLTPTRRPDVDEEVGGDDDRPTSNDTNLRSGGAGDLLYIFEKELIPFIDNAYRTNDERVLAGHSLASLFAAFVLMERPGLFRGYLLASPSLWWDDEVLVQRVSSARSTLAPHSLRVFLTVGGEETPEMKRAHKNFETALRSLALPSLSLAVKEYTGVEHTGTIVPSVLEGVSHIFAPRMGP